MAMGHVEECRGAPQTRNQPKHTKSQEKTRESRGIKRVNSFIQGTKNPKLHAFVMAMPTLAKDLLPGVTNRKASSVITPQLYLALSLTPLLDHWGVQSFSSWQNCPNDMPIIFGLPFAPLLLLIIVLLLITIVQLSS